MRTRKNFRKKKAYDEDKENLGGSGTDDFIWIHDGSKVFVFRC